MLRRAGPAAAALCRRALATSSSSLAAAAAPASSSAVNSILLRSLKEHYREVSKLKPPPKINPPKTYSIVKGALDQPLAPVLRCEYGEAGEEINISVASLADVLTSEAVIHLDSEGAGGMSGINGQLLLHVDISRPGSAKSLQLLCGLYPEAVEIHSVRLRSKNAEPWDGDMASKGCAEYQGPIFQKLDEKVRDAFHIYIEARGINEKLFPFLQAWHYVKVHHNLTCWFKSVGSFISETKEE